MPVSLTSSNLGDVPPSVATPDFDPSTVEVGIVHIGVGSFHRSHLAVYVDDLLAAGHTSWGIGGVGMRPEDRDMHDVLEAQDHLYTVVTMPRSEPRQLRVIGSIVDHLLVEDDREAVLERMAEPAVRIISLTVTEGGYFQTSDGSFDDADADIRADADDAEHPRTVFGLLVAALDRRRTRGIREVTVMSCDNLPGNGAATKAAVLGLAGMIDSSLRDWIEANTTFPSSMVDRITPRTSPELIASIAADPGLSDCWPVPAEPFRQWILEDDFSGGRPPFEDVGAQLVADVAPYELMKLRLLNGAHQVIAHLGIPAGHVHVHEALADEELLDTVRTYLVDEARSTLQPVPGVDVDDYIETLLDRFANPSIADTLERLAMDAHHRLRQFIVPVVVDRAAQGLESPIARRVLAAADFPLSDLPDGD